MEIYRYVGENLNEWDSFRKMHFLRLINLFKNYFENSLITINSRTMINKNKKIDSAYGYW